MAFEKVLWYKRMNASKTMRGQFNGVRGRSRRRGSSG
jgi:hypothetical protein